MLVWWVAEAVPLGVTSVLPLVALSLLGVTDGHGGGPVRIQICVLVHGRVSHRPGLGALAPTPPVCAEHPGGGWREATEVAGRVHARHGIAQHVDLQHRDHADDVAHCTVRVVQNPTRPPPRFPVALLLGTAYAANLGGIATLVGTPPNVAMAGLVEEHVGQTVPFLEWMVMALPFSAVMLGLVYVLLTRVLCRCVGRPFEIGGVQELKDELASLGAWSLAEKRVAVVFGTTALCWVARRWLVAHWDCLQRHDHCDGGRAMLFVIPSGRPEEALLSWQDPAPSLGHLAVGGA